MTIASARLAWDSSSEAGLPLRMAQRAFAAVLERRARDDAGDGGEFASAQLRSVARRTLSALSADEQSGLLRWLSLQVVVGNANEIATASSRLARVDAFLAAGLVATLTRTREELGTRVQEGAVAA
jgi:hypothetical protein